MATFVVLHTLSPFWLQTLLIPILMILSFNMGPIQYSIWWREERQMWWATASLETQEESGTEHQIVSKKQRHFRKIRDRLKCTVKLYQFDFCLWCLENVIEKSLLCANSHVLFDSNYFCIKSVNAWLVKIGI